MKNNKILIVTGGTGGHISPGIALYQVFKNQFETYFLTLERNKNYNEFIKKNINPFYYDSPRISKNLKDILLFPIKTVLAILKSIKIIEKHKINIIIGLGGYPTFPALISAILLRKKIYLCEQNVIPGNVTKLFSFFAKRIFLTFPIDEKKYPSIAKKSLITGNPIREELFVVQKELKPKKNVKNIFMTGGSQGAKQLNEMILNLWKDYPEFSKDYYWTIQTGISHLEDFKNQLEKIGFNKNIECFGFSTEIYEYFKKADVLICRAGAGNITEGILFSLPMILIPYPYAKDNHQLENAKYIEKQNAGIIIQTKSIEANELYQQLQKIIKEYDFYRTNIEAIKYHKNPAEIIKENIIKDL